MKFVGLVAIVEAQEEDHAIEVAQEAGAGGVSVMQGKNIGLGEKKVFFGLTLEDNVSILLFILPVPLSLKVLKALRETFEMDTDHGSGMVFTFGLKDLVGLNTKSLYSMENPIYPMPSLSSKIPFA